jgi:superfamily II DNA helicase RecQ
VTTEADRFVDRARECSGRWPGQMRLDQAAAIECSPLLAPMRAQFAAADRMGVRSATINSTDLYEWTEIEASLAAGATSGRQVGQNGAPLSISVTAALLLSVML